MLKMGIQCLGVFQSFKLAGKHDPPNIVQAKELVSDLIAKLSKLSDEPEKDYLDAHLPQIVSDGFCDKEASELSVLQL